MNYTKGPWVFVEDARVITGKTPNGLWDLCIAELFTPIHSGESHYNEMVANGYLIAAAPDLLEALENARNVLAALATGDLKRIGKDSPALQQAREAIKKARGEK